MTASKVFSIPAGVSFVDELAAGIIERVGEDPLALSRVTVLLPTRRSTRALRDAFLRRSAGRPLLLPRMSPLGELDLGSLTLTPDELPGMPLDLPEAINPLTRQLLLARLILAASGVAATTAQAVRLGADLGRLIDAVWTEGADFSRLATLVPEDYARHWQLTLDFLKIVTEHWPAILGGMELHDPAQRRNLVLQMQADLWRTTPPDGPVFAAGSTGSIVATTALLKVVSELPQGAVILPGLDLDSDEECWAEISRDEAHPQNGLARLLDQLEVSRDQVRLWHAREVQVEAPRAARARLVAEAMRPSAATTGWRDLQGFEASILKDFRRIDAPTSEEEATVVALLMRQALEEPGKRAALVTPDRNLARRVAMVLTRWGIDVDDSAGRPLVHTAAGTYLRLTAELAVGRVHPLDLLALAKHPLASGGHDPSEFRNTARLLERTVLRGPRPADGFEGLQAAVEATDFTHAPPGTQEKLLGWIAQFRRLAQPFLDVMQGRQALSDILAAHMAFAEALAAGAGESGAERLWRHDDGEEAAAFVHELLEAAAGFPELPTGDYPALIDALMAMRAVRPRYGKHPRLLILGPMEARLQHFDLMILGGLNEGGWPPDPQADPWMSRPMRKDFRLPSPERMVGLAAHDFTQCCGAPEVVLTRAERVEGTPTVPSRWLLRLETVLKAIGLPDLRDQGSVWLALARHLDEPDAVRPISPPEPRPPVEARPRKLSVTKIETWMRDPYAIYAEKILRLRKLDPIAADPGAADRGQFIHKALDEFVRAYPRTLPPDARERLLDYGRAAFGRYLESHPDVWAFWWPRFERIADWFLALESERRATIQPLATEVSGQLTLQGPGGPFQLTATADRIDSSGDGLVLIDYKTGTIPSPKEIVLGFAPQLPLEAAIASTGGFTGIAQRSVAELAFWRLSGGAPAGEEKPVKADPATLAKEAREGLEELIRQFDNAETPYRSCPRPAHAPRYTDYAHFARVAEWSAGGDGGEGM